MYALRFLRISKTVNLRFLVMRKSRAARKTIRLKGELAGMVVAQGSQVA
jgi:hypothetical protein